MCGDPATLVASSCRTQPHQGVERLGEEFGGHDAVVGVQQWRTEPRYAHAGSLPSSPNRAASGPTVDAAGVAAGDHRRSTPDANRGRNVVERSFNAIKQWRALATRYDKLALTYPGGVVLAAILTWPRGLGVAP